MPAMSLESLKRLELDHGIRIRRLDTIHPAPYEWLWRHRIPQGALTILNGRPDAGKTTIYTDIAARVTTGAAMPGESDPGAPGNVLFLATEDSYESVVRPRLEAAGADLSRVAVIDSMHDSDGYDGAPTLDAQGLRRIGAAVEAFRPRLFVVDPFTNYLPPDVDSHLDQHVRRVLNPIARMASSNQCAALVVRHNAIGRNRGAGSVGIGGIARSELSATKTGEVGELEVSKRNNAPSAPLLRYRFISAGEVAKLEWTCGNGTAAADTRGEQEDDALDRLALTTARTEGACSAARLERVASAIGLTISESKANRRLRHLAARGLLAEPGNAGRALTDTGARYATDRGW